MKRRLARWMSCFGVAFTTAIVYSSIAHPLPVSTPAAGNVSAPATATIAPLQVTTDSPQSADHHQRQQPLWDHGCQQPSGSQT